MNTPTLEYLNHLFRDADAVELRHQINGRWETSWFTSADDLLIEARRRSQEGNLFTSLNHVEAHGQSPITNDDVDRYCRILFDLDPDRPTDTAATDDEVTDAREQAKGIRRHLAAHGWPQPAIAMSGNGYHLQYRTALPNTRETLDQLAAIYAGLAQRFGDDVVIFDKSVKNPGRICTLYGSIKRKGSNTKDRPHRKSFILIPPDWRQVRAHQIEKLARLYAPKPADRPPERRLCQGRGITPPSM